MIVVDQTGREVQLEKRPVRMVSLVPSITEYLVDLGVEVVGRTKFCIHPAPEVNGIPIIGGTKNFRYEAIFDLHPDVLVGNKEENYKEGIERLSQQLPVWMSDVVSLEDSYDMMLSLGELFGYEQRANELVDQHREQMVKVKGSRSGTVIYLIWKRPWMGVGTKTFINSILEHLGYVNAIRQDRYPELTDEELSALNPATLLLSSEPYPFRQKDIQRIRQLLPDVEVWLVNGEAYSWYGSRMLKISVNG